MPKPQYGADHQRRRADWAAELQRTGGRQCSCRGQCGRHRGRCRTWIKPGDPFDLAHGLAHHFGGDGSDSEPGCPPCNRAEGPRIKARRPPASEEWW